MSSSDIAISIRGLGKAYTIRHNEPRHTTLAESIMHRLRHPFAGTAQRETFWALKDVSFDVKQGQVVGLIGRNGAGKSTLLKILSRITEPTTGEIDLYGRVGSLLEVGTGFHQELTGRENIYLNGSILGMRLKEIDRQFNAIVDFAGVEKFLDTPVKRYSSGMYVRLAFAVAAHLNPEILLVDEVLAVGDSEFQKKCLGKMSEVASQGRTIIFVSHSMTAITALCTDCVWLSDGQLIGRGSPAEVTRDYWNQSGKPESAVDLTKHVGRTRGSTAIAQFIKLFPGVSEEPAAQVRMGQALRIELTCRTARPLHPPAIYIGINNAMSQRVCTVSNQFATGSFTKLDGEVLVQCQIDRLTLLPGMYSLKLAIGTPIGLLDVIEDAARFEVLPEDLGGTGVLPVEGQGLFFQDSAWRVIKKSPDQAEPVACAF